MSIEFSLKLKGNTVNEKLLVNEINKLGVNVDINKNNYSGDILEIDSIYELLGFTVTLIRNKKTPYNVYETSFLETDFEYNQVILFEFNKEAEFSISYAKALKLIFNLMRILETSALLTSSVYDEICYFENNRNVHINRTVELLERINNIPNINRDWSCFYY